MQQASQLPDADEIRSSEVQRVLESIVRVRPMLLPVVVSLVLALILIEPRRESFALFGVLLLLAASVALFDRLRRRRGYQKINLALDVCLGVAIQTFLIVTTGLASSPILIAYLILAVLTGVALGRSRFYFGLLAYLFVAIWTMTAIELAGGLPWMFYRPTAALPFDPLVRAGVATVALAAVTGASLRVNTAVRRMLDRAIEARQQLLRALADRNRDLIDLSAAIGHELKNPLASIQGLVQLLERSPDNKERRFQVLQREIDRMKSTLDELLNLSRPIGELCREPIPARELTDALSTVAEGLASKRNVKLVPLTAEGTTLSADRRKLEQALHNLLLNAIEASPDGGEVCWVLEESGGEVQVGLRDNGPGLPPSVRDRLGTIGVTTKPEGSGIGLAVARAIAEQHGGRLILEDADGGGVSARIALPKEQRNG